MGLRYRPEIDGLRAVAVIAVILYHAEFLISGRDWFAGGFLGVDVFFVISGYLISSIILRELKSDTFSFKRFYERRARRILPALFTVILASLPLAWIYLVPKPMQEYAASVLASLFFGSNIWFLNEDPYTAQISALKPFLHTWSLSVEEQFYLFFPVLLLVIWKLARRLLYPILGLIFIGSLVVAHTTSSTSPDAAFYLIHTRAWELLAGGILAALSLNKVEFNPAILAKTMPAVGLLLILASSVWFDDQMRHPSLLTVIPVLGTMLLIWFCRAGEPISDFLSSKILVGVGLISYSLYLWHFPILAFLRINEADPSAATKLLAIAVAIALSILTYFYIEKPTRNKNAVSAKALVYGLLTATMVIIYAFGYLLLSQGAKSRFGPLAEMFEPQQLSGCHYTTDKNALGPPCVRNEDATNGALFLVGDSHAGHIDHLVSQLAIKRDDVFYQSTVSECIYVDGLVWVPEHCRGGDIPRFTNQWVRDEHAKDGEFTIIWSTRLASVLHGPFDNGEGGVEVWDRAFTPLEILPGFEDRSASDLIRENLELFARNSDIFVIVYPSPEVGWDVPKTLYDRMRKSKSEPDAIPELTTSLSVYQARMAEAFAILDGVQGDNIVRVYPHELFCSETDNRCATMQSGNVLYADDDHFSKHGSKLVVDEIERKLRLKNR